MGAAAGTAPYHLPTWQLPKVRGFLNPSILLRLADNDTQRQESRRPIAALCSCSARKVPAYVPHWSEEPEFFFGPRLDLSACWAQKASTLAHDHPRGENLLQRVFRSGHCLSSLYERASHKARRYVHIESSS